MNEILTFSAVAQSKLVRDGEITTGELVRLHQDRIAAIDPALNAVVEVLDPGPCSFLFSVKDSIEIKGHTCTAGTVGYRDRGPAAQDAALVARLRTAGGAPIARTNLPDLLFAFETDNLIFGRTNNPYDLSRTPGGSSGGEAALIAACGSPFGLGSDAAGSVRLPAHFCGIAALKPTSGRLPREGHVPPAAGWVEQLWQIGPMARHVEDLMWFMEVERRDIEDLRIAWFADNGIVKPDAETRRVIGEAAAALCATECRPAGIERSYDLEMAFLGPDGGDGVREFLRSIGSDRIHPLLDGWLAKHEKYRTNLAGFAQIWHELDDFRSKMSDFLTNFDVILSPVAAFPAVPHGRSIDDAVFPGFSYTMTYNLTGWPAAVVRCGQTADGLPIGVQVAAAPWREDIVLAVAKILEERFGGWSAPPNP